MDKIVSLTAISLLLCSSATFAETAADQSRIDPNTFIVRHPASPSWKVRHSNGEHPAVMVNARAAATSPDSNRFLVQPPASVRWTPQAEAVVLAAVPR